MKILLLSDKPPWPDNSGGAMALASMIKGLVSIDISVSLLSISSPKHPFSSGSIPLGIRDKINITNVEINTSIRLLPLLVSHLFSSIPYPVKRFHSSKYISTLKNILLNNRYDIVQIEGINLASALHVIRKYSKAKISFRAHNSENEIWKGLAKRSRNFFEKFYYSSLARKMKKYEIRVASASDFLIPISSSDYHFFKKNGFCKPALIIPYGTDIKELSTKEEERNTLAYLSSLDWKPNQEGLRWFLDNVWDRLRKLNPEVRLRVAGRNSPKSLVKLFHEKDVEYLGWVEKSDIFLSNSSIVIIPLLTGSGVRVGMIEAMAMKKAIVTTSKGSQGLDITNGKNCLIADTPESYVQAIQSLLTNEIFLKEIQDNAIKYAIVNHLNGDLSKKLSDFYTSELNKQ